MIYAFAKMNRYYSTFLPSIKELDEGHIVLTASIAGLISVPNLGPYNATKFAVVSIAETLRQELLTENSKVGVSCLCPGFVSTNIFIIFVLLLK